MPFLVIVWLFTGTAAALDTVGEQSAMLGTHTLSEGLSEDARELAGEFSVTENASFGKRFLTVVQDAFSKYDIGLGAAVDSSRKILAIVLIAAVGSSLSESVPPHAVRVAAVCTLFSVVASDVGGLMQMGVSSVDELQVFSQTLLPVMAAAAAASGLPASSAGMYAASSAFLSILVSALRNFMIPLVRAYLVMGAVDAVVDVGTFSHLKKFTESLIKNVLKFSMLAFTAYLLLTGIVSGNADVITLKAAKLAISTFVPVVGGMISDASETVLVSAKLILHSVGIYGMLGALSVLILPFIRIGMRYIMLNITVFLSSSFDTGKVTGFLTDAAKAAGFLLAVVCCCCLFVFVSCVCFIRVSAG